MVYFCHIRVPADVACGPACSVSFSVRLSYYNAPLNSLYSLRLGELEDAWQIVELPQELLCSAGQVQAIDGQEGAFPSDPANAVYPPGEGGAHGPGLPSVALSGQFAGLSGESAIGPECVEM